MIFKKETEKKYRIPETDIKQYIKLIEKALNEEKEIKVEYTPEMFFKYRHTNNIITLGCTDIMSDEELEPESITEEDLIKIITDRIIGLSVFKAADHLWIHEINVLVFDRLDEDGKLILDEDGNKQVSKQLEVYAFIKMENDPLFEHMEDENELNVKHNEEKQKMIKKLEDMLHAAKRRV